MEKEVKDKAITRRRVILRFIVLIFYMLILMYLYYFLTQFGVSPLLISLIIIFVLLTLAGPLFRNIWKKSFYSKMFPDKKEQVQESHERPEFKIKSEKVPVKPRTIKNVNLNFKYRRSIINKCENCGMTITSFAKTCPNCGKSISGKRIIRKCENCGMTIPNFVKKCPVCGNPISKQKKF